MKFKKFFKNLLFVSLWGLRFGRDFKDICYRNTTITKDYYRLYWILIYYCLHILSSFFLNQNFLNDFPINPIFVSQSGLKFWRDFNEIKYKNTTNIKDYYRLYWTLIKCYALILWPFFLDTSFLKMFHVFVSQSALNVWSDFIEIFYTSSRSIQNYFRLYDNLIEGYAAQFMPIFLKPKNFI